MSVLAFRVLLVLQQVLQSGPRFGKSRAKISEDLSKMLIVG
jgi:hypothetical protein